MSPQRLTEPDFGELVDVHLLEMPVDVWARTQEHTDELLREFALMSSDPESAAEVPVRLTHLIEVLTATYSGVGSTQEAELFAAAETGQPQIDDLAFTVPLATAEACIVLGETLDAADEYCQTGQHLLTLATPKELQRFRRWYLGQFVDQIRGADPVPWPSYSGS
jgi:hypothetical protein